MKLKYLLATFAALIAGFIFLTVSPAPAEAGYCAAQTTLDWFVCNAHWDEEDNKYCLYEYNGQHNYDCTSSPCQTEDGVCSSNDASKCSLDGDNMCALWRDSCSKGNCWVDGSTPTDPPGATPTPGGDGACGNCGGCFANSRVPACPDSFPSNAGQGVCSVGEHACCQPACPGDGGDDPPALCQGQSKPADCCNPRCQNSCWGPICDQQHLDWGTCDCCGGGPPYVGCPYNDPGWQCDACPASPTPAPCTIPAPPTLLSPPANAIIPGITTSLNWFESDWGNCPGSRRFGVFIGACGSLPVLPNDITTVSSYSFTGTSGQSYCWTVDAIKGIYASFKAPIRRFTFQSPTPTPTPTLTPTPTPTSPPTVTIQGRHKNSIGNDIVIAGQNVTISGPSGTFSSASSPSWFFNSISPGTYSVTASNIVDYTTSYAVCINCSPPSGAYTIGNSLTVNLPVNSNYADIYFKYILMPSPTPTPIIISVNGTVYDDPIGDAGPSLLTGKCFVPGTYGDPVKPGGGSKVRVDPDGQENPVQGNGTYTVTQVLEAGAKDIIMQGYDPAYQCTCPTGCQYGNANIANGSNSGWDFFVSQIRPRWLKVFGGSAHVQGNLVSNVPSGDVFMADFPGSDSPGALTNSSTSQVSFVPGSLSSQPLWNYNDQLSASAWKYGYRAMWLRAGNPNTDPGDGNSPPAAGGVYRKTGDWTILGGGSWSNLSGSRVIFVNGNVTINGNITLANGAFLGIVASGNIAVNPSVGNAIAKANPTSADANLTGAFFANGNFSGGTTEAQNDKQLVIYGSVAADAELNGSGSVNTQRDLGNFNSTSPAVAFIWNPFLILNAPQAFTDAVMDWREVAP